MLKKIFSFKKKLLFSFIIFILLLYTLNKVALFEVNEIIINKFIISENRKKELLHGQKYKNIYLIDEDILKENIQKYYSTRQVKIEKSYPNNILVNFMIENPIAYVQLKNLKNRNIFGINSKGLIINVVDREAIDFNKFFYPIIFWNNDFKVSELNYKDLENIFSSFIIDSILNSLVLLKNFNKKFYQKIFQIRIYKNLLHNELLLRNVDTRFRFGESLNLNQLLSVIALEDDLINIVHFSLVDLRFKDIIGRY